MTAASPEIHNSADARGRTALAVTGLAALGIVFGDIGTSPLYTLKTAFDFLGGDVTPDRILGMLSLLLWTLFLITSIKYVTIAMSIDNDGEGGILALMSLLGVQRQHRPAIILAGLLGAALIYGDGAITPAISVLSALEGFEIAAPSLSNYVLPAAVVILVLLFAVQPLGTSRIGAAFGPVMLVWFISIGALGLWGVTRDPEVLLALNPLYSLHLLATNGMRGFAVLGGSSSASPAPRRFMPTWGISAKPRSASPGRGSCFPAWFSITPANRRSRFAASRSRTTSSIGCVRNRCSCR